MNLIDEKMQTGSGEATPVRVYRPDTVGSGATPLVLHLHGGAFVGGSLDSGRTSPILLARAGATVASVAYPQPPKHRFPFPLEIAFAALRWLDKSRSRWSNRKSHLFVAGEEAGGNLAAGLALMARDRGVPPLAGQILLSPMLDPRMATCSVRRADAGPVGCRWADGWHEYLGSPDKAAHPYASPIASRRLSGLAPALVVTAEDDLLRDESVSYAQRLRGSGVAVDEHVLPAPTGWPCALSDPVAEQAGWAKPLEEILKSFFARTLSAFAPPKLSAQA